jgi:hypothetical protein
MMDRYSREYPAEKKRILQDLEMSARKAPGFAA